MEDWVDPFIRSLIGHTMPPHIQELMHQEESTLTEIEKSIIRGAKKLWPSK